MEESRRRKRERKEKTKKKKQEKKEGIDQNARSTVTTVNGYLLI